MKKISILLFLGLFVFSACKKDDIAEEEDKKEETKDDTPDNNQPSSYYISFKIDGVEYTIAHGQDNAQVGPGTSASIDSQNDNCSMDTRSNVTKYDSNFNAEMYGLIEFGTFNFVYSTYLSDKEAALESMTTVGSKTFRQEAPGPHPDTDVTLDIYLNGTFYSSRYTPQTSTASLKITESTLNNNNPLEHERDVKGTFSGIAVSEDNGSNIKQVTDGTFHLFYQAY